MTYISELEMGRDRTWIDGITNKSNETILYITICGHWNSELLEALDCIYLDHKREFELITLKKEMKYIGACIVMKPETKK